MSDEAGLTRTGRDELLREIVMLRAEKRALEASVKAYKADAEAYRDLVTNLQGIGSRLVIQRQKLRENIALNLERRGQMGLAKEVRALELEDAPPEYGHFMPGWFCSSCHTFTGEVKQMEPTCRGCGATRPV